MYTVTKANINSLSGNAFLHGHALSSLVRLSLDAFHTQPCSSAREGTFTPALQREQSLTNPIHLEPA